MLVAPRLLGMTNLEAAILGSILAAVVSGRGGTPDDRFHGPGARRKKGHPHAHFGRPHRSDDDLCHCPLYRFSGHVRGRGGKPVGKSRPNGPISIVLGIITGLIPGYFLYRLFTKYDGRPPKRTIVVMGMAIFLTWLERGPGKLDPNRKSAGRHGRRICHLGKIRGHRPYYFAKN